MSQYYNPNRQSERNYGGPKWRLSRSKIALFLECPRCFYVDNKLGVARPPGFPFALNSAVDALLKKEFDMHRANGTAHPLMKAYNIDAVPFVHKEMNVWRENFRGVECKHRETGFTVSGAVDDVWVNPQGALIVVDYKSTSKDEKIEALDKDWHDGYKRQMEIYQWLLRQKGFKVSDTGYFVYANASKDKAAFDARLEFEVTLVPYKGSTAWVEGALRDIKKCLEDADVPPKAPSCDYCNYREATARRLAEAGYGHAKAGKVLMKAAASKQKKALPVKKPAKSYAEKKTGKLF